MSFGIHRGLLIIITTVETKFQLHLGDQDISAERASRRYHRKESAKS